MSICSTAEIAEKKRLALEKLRAKRVQLPSATAANAISTSNIQVGNPITPIANKAPPSISGQLGTNKFYSTSATTLSEVGGKVIDPSAFSSKQLSSIVNKSYVSTKNGNSAVGGENKASAFYTALRQSNMFSSRKEAREIAHPYQRTTKLTTAEQSVSMSTTPKQMAPVFSNAVTCKVYLISPQRFAVQPSSYHEKLIEMFKTIPSKSYDINTRIWSFLLDDYELLQKSVSALKPGVVIGTIPKTVVNLCRRPLKPSDRSCLVSIEQTLAEKLMPFQQDGVCFAISQHGRVMICDEMGLGKTYQALAIADFYKENWPLLICTTASTRESWSTHVRQLLPSVPLHYIQVLSNQQQFIGDARVLITSYHMMEKSLSKLIERKFGVIIFDESHALKNSKAKCTIVADRLALMAKNVVLLSGTPALSRPLELFTQLQLVDRKFMNFMEYTSRYCDGKHTNFGWDATGQSNLDELNVVLKLKFMLRRLKAEVLPEMAEKSRETVILDPALIWSDEDTEENLNVFAKHLLACKGKEKEEILLKFYAETAKVKKRAVCAYLKGLVAEKNKFIVFAHHRIMMDAITDCFTKLKVNFIRIDGSTRNEQRVEYINEFQNKTSCKVAVLSLKACNSGITLTAADMIIFAELDWNPSTLAQAESRAHRIGQERPVICRYLMASKTADDVIWHMIKAKQDVLNRVGIFAENLQEATHIAAPTTSHKIDKYLVPDNNPHTNSDNNSNLGDGVEKATNGYAHNELKDLDKLFGGDDDDFDNLKF